MYIGGLICISDFGERMCVTECVHQCPIAIDSNGTPCIFTIHTCAHTLRL